MWKFQKKTFTHDQISGKTYSTIRFKKVISTFTQVKQPKGKNRFYYFWHSRAFLMFENFPIFKKCYSIGHSQKEFRNENYN